MVLESLVISQKTTINVILAKMRYSSSQLFIDYSVCNIYQFFLKTLLIYINANKDKMFTEYVRQYPTCDRLYVSFVIPKHSHTRELTPSHKHQNIINQKLSSTFILQTVLSFYVSG